MTERNAYRFGPTRRELWFWLCVSLGGLAVLSAALFHLGLPDGPALAEVVVVPVGVFGFLGGRSVKRLIRRQHP